MPYRIDFDDFWSATDETKGARRTDLIRKGPQRPFRLLVLSRR